jgi:hypothetical protein
LLLLLLLASCRKYSIDADAMPWDNDADTAAMLAALRSHHYQALVLDSPVVQYFAAQAEQCDLFPVGECKVAVWCAHAQLHHHADHSSHWCNAIMARCASLAHCEEVCRASTIMHAASGFVSQQLHRQRGHHLCALPAGGPFETFDLAIAFPPDVPLGLPQNITTSIVRLQVGHYWLAGQAAL